VIGQSLSLSDSQQIFCSPGSLTNGERRTRIQPKRIPPKLPCSAARAEDRSRNRFVNLVFRFNNKWCYKSEEITAIFSFLRIQFCEQINIRMEENNRHSCGRKISFERNKRSDYCCGMHLELALQRYRTQLIKYRRILTFLTFC
jgi:hypothetical protein